MDGSGSATSEAGIRRVHSGSWGSGLEKAREAALMFVGGVAIFDGNR
jgi:hypothetical protein